MDYVILVSGSKEASGFCEIDDSGITQTSNYKQSAAKKNCVSLIGRDGASFSGISSLQSDYIAVAQAEKPALVLYQRGKTSPLFQCPIQEIVNCLTSDATGTYLFSGTRKGFVYIHDVRTGELVTMWQAHLKAVSKLQITSNSQFLVSVGEDGLGKCWNIPAVVDPALTKQHGLLKAANKANDNRLLTPFRSWNAHSLPVTDVSLIDFGSCLRAITCSLDRTVYFYDVLHQSSLSRVTLPGDSAAPLECLAISNGLEYVLTGSSTGKVFIIDISVVAAGVSAVQHAKIVGSASYRSSTSSSGNNSSVSGVHTIDAHSLAVTSIVTLPDNERFITASLDGYVKFYHMFTRQLLIECTPLLQRGPVTNLSVMLRAESSSLAIVKPTVAAVAPLKKYVDSAGNSTSAAVAAANNNSSNNNSGSAIRNVPSVNIVERITSVVGASHSQGLTPGCVVLGPTFLGVDAGYNIFQQTENSLKSLRERGDVFSGKSSGAREDVNDEEDQLVMDKLDVEEEFIRLPEKVLSKQEKNTNTNTKKNIVQVAAEDEDSDEDDGFMKLDDVDDGDDREDEDEDEDHSLGTEDIEEEEEEEEDDESNEEDLKMQLQTKDNEIAVLQEESQRWKSLCEQMKEYIESMNNSSTGNKRGREDVNFSTGPTNKEERQGNNKKQKKQHK